MSHTPLYIPLVDRAIQFFEKNSLWYEDMERFVIIEKFESQINQIKIGIDDDKAQNIEYMRFINEAGEPHRNNGNPSFMSKDTIMWHKNGKLHRKNGKPAICRNVRNGRVFGWEHLQNNYDSFGGISENFPKEEYLINGLRHRDFDLPAVVFENKKEHKYWFKDGVMHRDGDKPAVINGSFLYFFKNGKLYKSDVCYGNKFSNWIVKNPLYVSGIIFLITTILTLLFV